MSDIREITPSSQEWPHRLFPPLEADRLWVKGDGGPLRDLLQRSVGIVGARASTAYGDQVAGWIALELAEAGVTVVSGGALGVDSAAHRGALEGRDSRTIAVLGCGVDVVYPRTNAHLFERIAERGLLVSAYPPGTPPSRHRFLERNYLLAMLSHGVVVVEAGQRSGSLHTARLAHQMNQTYGSVKPLMAVPGAVTSVMSQGTNQLIADRMARLVTSGQDVLEVMEEHSRDLSR